MDTPTNRPTRSLSVKQVIERLCCSRAWLYVLLRTDKTFPCPFKRGKRTLFVEAEVEDWLQQEIEANRMTHRK